MGRFIAICAVLFLMGLLSTNQLIGPRFVWGKGRGTKSGEHIVINTQYRSWEGGAMERKTGAQKRPRYRRTLNKKKKKRGKGKH